MFVYLTTGRERYQLTITKCSQVKAFYILGSSENTEKSNRGSKFRRCNQPSPNPSNHSTGVVLPKHHLTVCMHTTRLLAVALRQTPVVSYDNHVKKNVLPNTNNKVAEYTTWNWCIVTQYAGGGHGPRTSVLEYYNQVTGESILSYNEGTLAVNLLPLIRYHTTNKSRPISYPQNASGFHRQSGDILRRIIILLRAFVTT